VRIASPSATLPNAFAEVQYYASTNCTVTPIGVEVLGTSVAGDTAAAWVDLPLLTQTPPVGARSAYVSFVTLPGAVADFDANFDRLFFQFYPFALFSDGFESGDTTQWFLQFP
jgi:hypothetical protein